VLPFLERSKSLSSPLVFFLFSSGGSVLLFFLEGFLGATSFFQPPRTFPSEGAERKIIAISLVLLLSFACYASCQTPFSERNTWSRLFLANSIGAKTFLPRSAASRLFVGAEDSLAPLLSIGDRSVLLRVVLLTPQILPFLFTLSPFLGAFLHSTGATFL